MGSHIFREYDIRGVAERDLTDEITEAIGRGLAEMLPTPGARQPRVVVARDCRLSGPRLFKALTNGLTRAGVDVIDVGVGPTPLMYFAVHHLDAAGGVMITGSHNPKDENGFKIMKGKASFFGRQLQQLAHKISKQDFRAAPQVQGELQSQDLSEEYLTKTTSGFRFERPELKFVVDGGNGSAGPLGLEALKRVGLDPIALYCDMDGTFPNHHPDPTQLDSLKDLIRAVKEQDAVVGLAWDGDGDRVGVIDQTGEVVWGDRLLALFARFALPDHPGGKVIADVKCSQTLFDDVNEHGGEGIMWKTGHSLIKSKMKESDALMAGEMSGHFFFRDRHYGYDDAIYAALRVLEILSQTGQSVGELLRDLPQPAATPELRVDCPDAIKFEVVARVKQHFADSGAQVTDIDGVRVNYEDGSWGLVRASNTGPKLVLRFEGPTEARRDELHQRTEKLVISTRDALSN